MLTDAPIRRGCTLLGLLAALTCTRLPPAFGGPPSTISADQASRNNQAQVPLDDLPPLESAAAEPTTAAKPLSSRGQRIIAKARRLTAEQRYTEAAMELERALQSDAESVEVHLELARVLHAARNLPRCRTHLTRAAAFAPDNLVVRYLQGAVAAEDGDRPAAIREWRLALMSEQTAEDTDYRALVQYRLAGLLAEGGYLTAALELYQAAEQSIGRLDRPTLTSVELLRVWDTLPSDLERARAELYEQLGDYDQAADALARVLKLGPALPSDQIRLTTLLSRAGRHEEAQSLARTMIATDPSQASLLLEVYRAAGNPGGAVADLEKLSAAHPEKPDLLLAFVDVLEEIGRAGEAREALQRFLETQPHQANVRWRLFAALIKVGAWPDALGTAARAVAADESAAAVARSRMLGLEADQIAALLQVPGTDWTETYLLGCLALHVGQRATAEQWLNQTLAERSEFVPARLELADALTSQYRWQECLDLLEGIDQDAPGNARVKYLLGAACAGLDRNDDAATYLHGALRANRKYDRANRALAELYERTNKPLRAIRQYQALLETNPLDEAAHESLFQLLLTSDEREATGQLEKLRRLAASPNRIARCAALLDQRAGAADFEKFRTTLRGAMEQGGPDGLSLYLLGVSYLEERQYERARELLDEAAVLDPETADIQLALEYACRMTLDFERSANILRRMLERFPNRREWASGLIDVLITDQAFDQAEAVCRNFLDRTELPDEDRSVYRQALAETLEAARRFDELLATVTRWYEALPEEPDIRLLFVTAHLSADQPAGAQPAVEAWLSAAPDNEGLQELHTELLAETGQTDRACQFVLEKIEQDPDNDRLQRLLIARLSDAGRHSDALELARNCALDSRSPLGYQELMLRILQTARRHDEAIRLLSELLQEQTERPPDQPRIDVELLRREIVAQLIQGNRHDEALVRLNRWVEEAANPRSRFEYLRLLAICHQDRGRVRQATEALETAHGLFPFDAGINNDLGYYWVDRNERFDEAERCLRYAVAREPRNHAFLDSLGWLKYKQGDFEVALHWLARSLRAGAHEDPVVSDHYGDACWRAGRTEEALEAWRSAKRFAEQRLSDEASPSEAEDRQVLEAVRRKLTAADVGEVPELAPLGVENKADESAGRPSQAQSERAEP